MLKPNKYTNIKLSVLGISAGILALLESQNYQKYNDVLNKTLRKTGEGAKVNFPIALCLLFTIGKVTYHEREDVLELV